MGVGIRGYRMKKEKDMQQAQDSIESAFHGELQVLMDSAKDLVQLSKKYTDRINKGQASEGEVAEFQAYLLSLGIPDPVTRKTHGEGTAYQQELARELAGFLAEPLQRGRGMVLLQDVYCLYNRARGTELISPDDLVDACKLMETMGFSMVLHTFASGVKAIRVRGGPGPALREEPGGGRCAGWVRGWAVRGLWDWEAGVRRHARHMPAGRRHSGWSSAASAAGVSCGVG